MKGHSQWTQLRDVKVRKLRQGEMGCLDVS